MRDVPREVRLKATAEGAAGARWLENLDELVRDLEREWGVTVGRALRGGSEAYVAEARTAAGDGVVLKVAIPGNDLFDGEVQTLEAAAGRGYVRLLAHDRRRQALLLERLGPPLSTLGLGTRAELEILCEALASAWSVPAPPGLRTGAEKARLLAVFVEEVWTELREPCPVRVIETALAFAASREAADDAARAVLVHGDAGASNALRRRGGRGFAFVDPDGLFAEPAYDLAIPLRELRSEILGDAPAEAGRAYCAVLAGLTGVDADAIWEWAFLERVSTGLLASRVGLRDAGAELLAVAERWAWRI